MPETLEIIMLVCFGLSWPINMVHHIRAKTTKGVSLPFMLLIITGYTAGISKTVISQGSWFVLTAYIVNITMVILDLVIYFLNRAKEKKTT